MIVMILPGSSRAVNAPRHPLPAVPTRLTVHVDRLVTRMDRHSRRQAGTARSMFGARGAAIALAGTCA